MSEPANSGWPQSPGAWRVALACEEAAQRFERAMHDLETIMPEADVQERVRTTQMLIQKAADEIERRRQESTS